MSSFIVVYNVNKYFLYTKSIFIGDLLKNWRPASEMIIWCSISFSVPTALVSWICDMFALFIVTHYSSVLFFLKLQQGYLSYFRFLFPPLDRNVDFKLVTHVFSSFRWYVKLKSKFAKLPSVVNLVQNLNLFILTEQTVDFLIWG